MQDMEGKIALVVAGSKGLGRASALKMAMRGGGRIRFVLSSSVREPIVNLLLSSIMRPVVAGLAKSLSRSLGGEGVLVRTLVRGIG